MINLLPQNEKQQLIFQKNRNLIVVLGSAMVIFLICLCLVFLALKFYILQNLSYEKNNLNEAKGQYQTAQHDMLLTSLRSYNALIVRADNFYKKESYFSDILDLLLTTQRPKGITFNNVVLERSGTKIKSTIRGFSSTRDDLLAFQQNVGSHSNVKNVNLPAEDLIKPSNISFTMTLEIQPK